MKDKKNSGHTESKRTTSNGKKRKSALVTASFASSAMAQIQKISDHSPENERTNDSYDELLR